MSTVYLAKGQSATKLKYLRYMIVDTVLVVGSLAQEIVAMACGSSQVFDHHG